ncbi:glucosaminidase domain-containing protein [Moheibacter sediminis]|uniref:Peptidoglycan hydrolase n=1 Tax=Moheibacter sediminis TaxID=1434700 RepID=A0A1W2A7S8_9FLAO|nr:glucosaminidase domain-containing protein [Moheibacter sediminis]SMC56710.1 Flagellum-specific peptidoglycan hydrolase FlgJ [Moheibacter sediminis]
MIKKLALLTFLLLFSIKNFAQESKDIEYIRLYAKLAVEEMHLYKIPASITLSQGILETGGGQSRLAEKGLNHFGIKCKTEWTGKTMSHTDDAPNECFRVYNSVQESYRDHSKFLAERPYYKDLFKLDILDYKAWAHGLKKAGYATNPKYAGILISRIEKYNLDKFDKLLPHEVEKKLIEMFGPSSTKSLTGMTDATETAGEVIAAVIPDPISKTVEETIEQTTKTIEVAKREDNPMMRIKKHANGIQYIIAYDGESISKLANLYEISPKKLASFNELPENGKLTPGQFVFLDKKKTTGKEKFYKVQQGDNMYLISQKVGMKIGKLYSFNKIKAGQQPKAGTVLNLKTKKK